MATLKSQKMVRGRDLKTPLAASTMDKKSNGKKGGPGDRPKKKKKTKKYSGDPNYHTKITYSTGKVKHLRKGELEKIKDYGSAVRSGKLKKKVLPDGRIHYTYKND